MGELALYGLVQRDIAQTSPVGLRNEIRNERGLSNFMDEMTPLEKDLVQVSRLAAEGKDDDLRLLLARLVRRYRSKNPPLSSSLSKVLESAAASPARRTSRASIERRDVSERPASEGPLSILRVWDRDIVVDEPVFHSSVRSQLDLLLTEWRRAADLRRHGLEPVGSAIFVGPPGVGKTQSARWLASQLALPMFSLDLTAVMSSRLGQSGANLRYALDYAKSQPSVLFLDEIDSIAKKRADQADVGELKRLVTIMLQELDDWPSTSLLLAATNHPELVDPALWRRFGLEVQFPMPAAAEIKLAVEKFLGPDKDAFQGYLPALRRIFAGDSYSDIERTLVGIRRSHALTLRTPDELVESLLQSGVDSLTRSEKIELALDLSANGDLSQHQVSRLTSVSRDTIRKRSRDQLTDRAANA